MPFRARLSGSYACRSAFRRSCSPKMPRGPLAQEGHHLREQRHVRAGMAREPDRVWVLLDGRVGDLFWRLVQTGVDELEPGVAKDAGDHLAPAVMAVQARLGDDDPKLARHDRQSS